VKGVTESYCKSHCCTSPGCGCSNARVYSTSLKSKEGCQETSLYSWRTQCINMTNSIDHIVKCITQIMPIFISPEPAMNISFVSLRLDRNWTKESTHMIHWKKVNSGKRVAHDQQLFEEALKILSDCWSWLHAFDIAPGGTHATCFHQSHIHAPALALTFTWIHDQFDWSYCKIKS